MARIFKGIFDNRTLIIIILIGIASILIDGPKLKKQGFTKELAIVRGISYFYILFGIVVFILIKII